MMYQAKEGSKAYNYIKSVCKAEEKEYKAYVKRVEDTIGFKYNQYVGYYPNCCFSRKYLITALIVEQELWEELDKKIWKKEKVVDGTCVQIIPNKRTKKGKEIAAIFSSYNAVTNHFKIFNDLGVSEPESNRFSLTQLFTKGKCCFVYFDNSIRADKENNGLVEITLSEYERLISKQYE